MKKLERICNARRACGAKMIVGIGGGKRWTPPRPSVLLLIYQSIIVIPTLASTDAPCSSLVVIYTAQWSVLALYDDPHNPSLVSHRTRRW